MQLAEQINQKWSPVLDHPDLPEIKDSYRRAVTALCLENVSNSSNNQLKCAGSRSFADFKFISCLEFTCSTSGITLY